MHAEIPWHPVKPIRGGCPLDDLYEEFAGDPKWVCQAKLDGRRALWDGSTLWSRQGNRLDQCKPILELLRKYASGVELDGEYMVVKGTSQKEACFYPFDIPTHHKKPLSKRWGLLMGVLEPMVGSGLVEPCPHDVTWEQVETNGWEGVVFKRLSSFYKRGISPGQTTPSWIKYRAEWLPPH